MNSAISTPTFQALAGNIKNADGVTPIYSAGAWDFRNSAGAPSFTIANNGIMTINNFNSSATHACNGQMRFAFNNAYGGFLLQGVTNGSDTSTLYFAGASLAGGNNGAMSFNSIRGDGTNLIVCGGISGNGQFTIGPTPSVSTNTILQRINGQPTILNGNATVGTSPVNLINFTNMPGGMYLVTAVKYGANVGTNIICWVGYTGGASGTLVVYSTLASSALTASVSTTFFRVTAVDAGNLVHCNALYMVGGA